MGHHENAHSSYALPDSHIRIGFKANSLVNILRSVAQMGIFMMIH